MKRILFIVLCVIDVLLILAMFLICPEYQAQMFIAWVVPLLIIFIIMLLTASKEW